MVLNPYLVDLEVHGNLTVLENIGFDIQRIFYITNVPSHAVRGNHGHLNTTQFLVCISGSVDITIKNNNDNFSFSLNNTLNKGIMMPPNNYIVMKNFSKDCILLVAADTVFKDDIYYTNNK
jgi:dTDP-4-dehydrorhamnose 3,5-epimerase-like enzyme